MRDTKGFDLPQPFSQLCVVVTDRQKPLPNAGGVHFSGGEDTEHITASQGQQDRIEGVVDGSGQRGDEAPQARALDANRAGNQRQGGNDIPCSACITG